MTDDGSSMAGISLGDALTDDPVVVAKRMRTNLNALIAEHTPPNEFRKGDSGKTLMGCLPPNALMATARVLTFGAAKYGRDNWHRVGAWSRYYDAMQRHLFAWWSGENLDPDTGESHLAHAACCLLFLAELEALKKSVDDRPFSGKDAAP